MATVANRTQPTSVNTMGDSRSTSVSQGTSPAPQDPLPVAANGAATGQKKGKGKKTNDPADATKAIQARISQLVQEQAGEKDQEAEIGEYTWI